ncbi:uncharacterized protein BDR25DRAFT_118148 [Lindgomyces ingoldianus]|uniref:Uncharacterized protein n=1 Tax=Lindgomyces ingoldianus TaxID=673940 RepID=A0ACB6Q935_9PLEO|nr:uncharacterized protein BDR25DRAFT_118148 [Lindgomyces ingoldianus]KAF2462867.1 hypothetical protein BDR25DRAFT_118148 [Lindgomyces ingoldianus]
MAQIGIATGIITLLEKSLAFYRVIAAAKNFGSDAAHSVMMLRFEAFRYQEWARENKNITAIFQDSSNEDTSRRQTQMIGLTHATQPISPVATFREALCDAVTQIIEVLRSVDKLLTKYNRAFEAREESNDPINLGVESIVVGPGLLQDEMQNAAQKYSRLKESLQLKTSFARRAKYGIQTWNDADKETLKDLVERFKYWNDSIHQIAPPEKPNLQELRMASQLVVSARSSAQLESVREAAAESSYKSVSRSAGLKMKMGEAFRDPGLKKNYADVKIDTKIARSRRFLTEFYPEGMSGARTQVTPRSPANFKIVGNSGSPSSIRTATQRVITEWYYYDSRWNDDQAKLADDRVERLAHRFSASEKPVNLHVLDCVGWIQHPSKRDRALLYKVPDNSDCVSQTSQPVTLHELLTAKQTPTHERLPSLGQRFKLAAALAVGFLELHTVGWIHKGFGSHNVLLFSDSKGKVCYDKPFISGFDFARPDTPREVSLSTRVSKFDLYRHPEIRELKPSSDITKPSSSHAHDVYSLGLVLFEIGMWMPLESYTKANLSPLDFRTRIQGYVARDLGLWMGNRFRDAVQSCLSGEYLQKSETFSLGETEEQIEDAEDLVDPATSDQSMTRIRQLGYFYHFIVAEIHGCQCEVGER